MRSQCIPMPHMHTTSSSEPAETGVGHGNAEGAPREVPWKQELNWTQRCTREGRKEYSWRGYQKKSRIQASASRRLDASPTGSTSTQSACFEHWFTQFRQTACVMHDSTSVDGLSHVLSSTSIHRQPSARTGHNQSR